MRSVRWGVLVIAAFIAVIAAPLLAAPQFPPLTGRVVDEAGLLTPAQRQQLTGVLAQFEAATKRQVVVATVKSLQGYPIEDYGVQLGRAWGIGEKGKNTGAILLVAPNERKVRIEVGYGLEGELTDSISSTIINQRILPAFRQGQYGQGIVTGTGAILQALGWTGANAAIPLPPVRPAAAAPGAGDPLGFLPMLLFMLMIWFLVWRLFGRRRGPANGDGDRDPDGRRRGGGVGTAAGMAMLGYGLGAMGGARFGGRGFGGGGFGGGFGGFGGGFGGGGGSFGGGGASGGW